MPEIVCSCPFVPVEWIAAHGLPSSRILPSVHPPPGPVGLHAGVCPYMRAFVNTACADPSTAGIVLTTACDQMRRAADVVAGESAVPVFLMHLPHARNCPAAPEMYRTELQRLGRFLVSRGGSAPTVRRLARVMAWYDRARARLRAAGGVLPPRAFAEALARFYRRGMVDLPPPAPRGPVRPLSLALAGGPLLVEGFGLFDLISRSGGAVALDATESGEVTLPAPFDRAGLETDPLGELVRAYYETIPAPFFRPNTGLHERIARSMREREIQGVILVRHLWCDAWHAEVQRFRERLDIPLLDIDFGGEDTPARFATRIQAFIENLT